MENNMEFKWFAIMLVGFIGFICIDDAVTEYSKNQCRVEAIKALKDPVVIKELCK